jgi:hypothetical protein
MKNSLHFKKNVRRKYEQCFKDVEKRMNKDVEKRMNKDVEKRMNKDVEKRMNKDVEKRMNKDVKRNLRVLALADLVRGIEIVSAKLIVTYCNLSQ